MKTRHLVSLLQDGYTTVKISFAKGSSLYTYKTHLTLAIGDYVVVDKRGGFSVGQVIIVDEHPTIDTDADFDYKWIVQKVDTTAYEKLLASEKEARVAIAKIGRDKAREATLAALSSSTSDADVVLLLRGCPAAYSFESGFLPVGQDTDPLDE
jgi:hypothetical protein